jgi:hypothetical protein
MRAAVMHEKILLETKKLLVQRGEVTKEQRNHAQVELEQMEKMYLYLMYYEEKRLIAFFMLIYALSELIQFVIEVTFVGQRVLIT